MNDNGGDRNGASADVTAAVLQVMVVVAARDLSCKHWKSVHQVFAPELRI